VKPNPQATASTTPKRHSLLWKIAKQRSRRKHVLSVPIALNADGDTVKMMCLIRGNVWDYRLSDLVSLTMRDRRPSRTVLVARALEARL
jgi:hypothetical protein